MGTAMRKRVEFPEEAPTVCGRCGGDFGGRAWYVQGTWRCWGCVRKMTDCERAVTDAVVVEVCENLEGGLSITDSCAKAGVNAKSLGKYVDGDEPDRPDWALMMDQAKAKCIEHHLKRLEAAGAGEAGMAGVNSAKHFLYALDGRFREDRKQPGDGLTVNIIVGQVDGEEPRRVTSSVVQRRLPSGEGD